jgi:hypothetical protein
MTVLRPNRQTSRIPAFDDLRPNSVHRTRIPYQHHLRSGSDGSFDALCPVIVSICVTSVKTGGLDVFMLKSQPAILLIGKGCG